MEPLNDRFRARYRGTQKKALKTLVAVTDDVLGEDSKHLLAASRATLRALGARSFMFDNSFVTLIRLMDPVTGLRSDDENFAEKYRWLEDHQRY